MEDEQILSVFNQLAIQESDTQGKVLSLQSLEKCFTVSCYSWSTAGAAQHQRGDSSAAQGRSMLVVVLHAWQGLVGKQSRIGVLGACVKMEAVGADFDPCMCCALAARSTWGTPCQTMTRSSWRSCSTWVWGQS